MYKRYFNIVFICMYMGMKIKTCLTIEAELLKKAKENKINISNAAEIGIRRVLAEPYGYDYVDEKPVTAEQIVKKQELAMNKLQLLIQDLHRELEGRSR